MEQLCDGSWAQPCPLGELVESGSEPEAAENLDAVHRLDQRVPLSICPHPVKQPLRSKHSRHGPLPSQEATANLKDEVSTCLDRNESRNSVTNQLQKETWEACAD